MKKFVKVLSVIICFNLFMSTSVIIPTALAATENNVKSSKSVSDRVNAILNGTDEKVEVSKIAKGEAYIPKGTKIPMEISQTITGKRSHEGDTIKFTTTQNIIINGVVVIPKDSLVYGQVIKAHGPGMLGRSGKLDFSIDSVNTINNVKIPLSYDSETAGKTDGRSVA